jgi:hypothetical protein
MTKSLVTLCFIILAVAIVAGIITLTIQKQTPSRTALKCMRTNQGLTLICTDAEGKKTIWREER